MTPGRLVLPALRWREDSGFEHETGAMAEALAFGAGGFILFGGTVKSVRALTRRLREAAGRDLLIASDLERGAGQQVRGLSELPPPLALAALGNPAVLRGAGLLTAIEALSVGINWVLAPVADLDLEAENPIVQTRAFGADPMAVSDAVAAWVTGCEAGGALACVKHFPGHGRTTADSHDTVPVVRAGAPALRGADFLPFRAAVAAGVSSVMTAHVAFPALDPSGLPATLSAPVLALLRRELGHGGLIVSDALMMEGARAGRGPGDAAVAALRAGVDLLLYPDHPGDVASALARAADADPVVADRVAEALGRYETALAAVASPAPVAFEAPSGSARALADWLLSRPLARGQAPTLRPPIDLIVVDDDEGGGHPPSSAADLVAAELGALGVARGTGGSTVAVVLAEPRASKGRARLGPDAVARLSRPDAAGAEVVVVCGHPRLVSQVPAGPAVLLAWHRQELMQRAVARWIRERMG